MTAPGARPKFRIDPTAPPAPPPPVPPPAAPPVAPPAPPPPRAPAGASSKRKWLIGGAVVAVFVVAGAAYAVFGLGVGGLVYPTKYLLTQSEAPHGLTLSDPSQASQQTPCDKSENPCKVNDDTLTQLADAGAKPKEGWVEAFDTPVASDGPVSILALKFNSNDDAGTFVGNAVRICGLGDQYGGVYQDGDVVVIFGASSRGGDGYMVKAVNALTGTKATGLEKQCLR